MPDSFRFIWDISVNRYRYLDSGRFVSRAAVERLTKQRIIQVSKDLRTIGQLLIDRKINLSTWEKETANALKILYIQNYTLNKGGAANMSDVDYKLLEEALRQEFQYLHKFALAVHEGKVTKPQFEARLNRYVKKSRYATELARRQVAIESSVGYAYRTLGAAHKHCSDCIRYASWGVQPVANLPLPTQKCICGSECKCTIHFVVSLDAIA